MNKSTFGAPPPARSLAPRLESAPGWWSPHRAYVSFVGAVLCAGVLPASAAVDAQGRWQAGIGDPTVGGWLTVLVYLGVAAYAGLNARSAQRSGMASSFWWMVTVALLLLGLNKQLDLQTWLTEMGRDMAMAQGWYERRGAVQVAFIGALALGAVAAVALLRRQLAPHWEEVGLTVGGVALLLLFVLVRATTFHHVDSLLRWDLAGLRVNVWLELTALVTIAAGCYRWRRLHRQRIRRFMFGGSRVR